MVRTKACKVVMGKSNKKMSSTAGNKTSDSKTSGKGKQCGGNLYFPRETPEWQKPITDFFHHQASEANCAGPSHSNSAMREENTDSCPVVSLAYGETISFLYNRGSNFEVNLVLQNYEESVTSDMDENYDGGDEDSDSTVCDNNEIHIPKNCSEGNPCCLYETPAWQKKITGFFPCLPKALPENINSCELPKAVQHSDENYSDNNLLKNAESDKSSNISSPMDTDNN